eukprot:gene1007-246_t
MEYREHYGDVTIPRFGHTGTFIGDDRMVLFGGAQGDGGKYVITDDTYILNCSEYEWSRLPDSETTPTPRAAHCASCIDKSQLVIYGGATGGGSLSSDSLYLLDYRNENMPNWLEVPVNGPTPGKRYGHSMSYTKPLLVTFGGNNGQHALNDIWFLNQSFQFAQPLSNYRIYTSLYPARGHVRAQPEQMIGIRENKIQADDSMSVFSSAHSGPVTFYVGGGDAR